MTRAFLLATQEGDRARAAAALGAAVPADWPGDAPVFLWLDRSEDPAALAWGARAVILRGTGEMVGHAGYHLPPGDSSTDRWAPGGVEIGYTIFEAHRGRGYATEAAAALVDHAGAEGVPWVMATTAVDNAASQAVLQRCGFSLTGEVVDDEDGREFVWVRHAGAN